MTQLWQAIVTFLQRHSGLSASLVNRAMWTAILLGVYFLLRWLLGWLTFRRVQDVGRRYVASKAVRYLLGFVLFAALVRVWVGGLAAFATYLGILSAGLAIALKDPLVNLAGWFYIVVRKPFGTGDRIQIAGHAGDVIDVSLFQFTLVEIGNWVDADQSTGRIVHVPNGWVFQHPTYNYTQGFNFLWNELPVTVTFESDWAKARDILTRIAQEHSVVKSEEAAAQVQRAARRFLIFYQHLTPIVWTSVAPHGVTLTIRYLCKPRGRRSSAARMWEEILREFAQCPDIDFAYPTTRFYRGELEGKPGLRPPP